MGLRGALSATPLMTTMLTLDRKGRVLIPKALRRELGLRPGDTLQLKSVGDKIRLRRMRPQALLKKECGISVLQSEPTNVSIADLIDRTRQNRIRSILGTKPGPS
jgi:AbrB family looped-hinge helix DNA binding protein